MVIVDSMVGIHQDFESINGLEGKGEIMDAQEAAWKEQRGVSLIRSSPHEETFQYF